MDNVDRGLNSRAFGDSGKPEYPSDSIMRKDHDVNEHGRDTPAREIRRVKAVAVPTNSSPLFAAAPIGPGRAGQTPPSMTELLFSVLRFKWTILLVSILVAAPLIAAIWTQVIPQYRARGEVQIRPIIPRLVFRTDENGAIPFYEGFVNTQVAVMRSPKVLQRVLDDPKVQATKWYREPPQSLKQRLTGQAVSPMETLKDALTVQPRRHTEILDVSFSCASGRDAEAIVNSVLEQYMKYVHDAASEQQSEEDAARDKLYYELKNEIDALVGNINILANALGTATPQELLSARRLRLDEAEASRRELDRRIAALELQVDQVGAVDGNDVIITGVQEQPMYDQDAEWRTLNENVRAIRHQIATSLLKPEHPGMMRMTKDLEYAEQSLRIREAQLDDSWRTQLARAAVPVPADADAAGPATVLMSPQQQLAQAKLDRQLLEEEYRKQKKEFEDLLSNTQKFESYNAELAQKRETFDEVRRIREAKEVERGIPGSIKVLTQAFAPSKPSEDRRAVFTAMVLFMGLGMGGGVAFLRASRNQTIYAPKDMPPTIQAPFLGYIPLTRIKPSLGKSLHDEIQKVRDDKIESVRLVRTALLSQLNNQGGATVLVASAAEGTGKSTFTVLLGKSLAQSGKKVIMIDADLRRMTLSKRFGLAGEPGFMESLRSKSVDQRYIFSTETSGLSILPAGIPNGDGSTFEGMANGAFKACLSQLRRHYDIVLLDSSPILPVADATIISGQVDGTIMVERELVSRRANVVDALARLDSAGGRLMGTVFVGSRENAGYGYGYGYGYGRTQYS